VFWVMATEAEEPTSEPSTAAMAVISTDARAASPWLRDEHEFFWCVAAPRTLLTGTTAPFHLEC
jgi:hypothetical protein